MAEAGQNRRGETRALLMRWGGTMEDIRRLERERDALRQWAEDARCTLRGRKMDGLPGGGTSRDLGDVVEAAMKRAQMYAEQSKRIDGEIAERLGHQRHRHSDPQPERHRSELSQDGALPLVGVPAGVSDAVRRPLHPQSDGGAQLSRT